MKTVGERIRQARTARGWSGQQLADAVGYANQSAIGNLENRARSTGGHKISAIARALDVSVEWLLNGPDSDLVPNLQGTPTFSAVPARAHSMHESTGPAPGGTEAELLQLYRTMSIAGQAEALRYMRYLAQQHRPYPLGAAANPAA